MARLALEQLQKRFGQVIALKGIELTVASGEFISLLGPSGCGKTTALRIIAGFEQADNGHVTIDGRDITRVPANRRDMGMVFQAYSLFPNMTARQNVEFGLRVRKRPAGMRTRRALELLELVGLSSAVDRYPHQLSGGQQQRVALARALAIEPAILLLDEPLSALDAKVRVQLREEIRRIQLQLGITTLYVTHDQEEALSVSDRVVVLSQGQIEQVGRPADIYGNPRTLFVADFIGTTNRLPGIVRADGLIQCGEVMIPVDAAREVRVGTQVVILLRPEAVGLDDLSDSPVQNGQLSGHVLTHTFLGSVTRLQVMTPVGELKVDVESTRALSLGIGSSVAISWDSAVPRILDVTTAASGPGMSSPGADSSIQLQPVAQDGRSS